MIWLLNIYTDNMHPFRMLGCDNNMVLFFLILFYF